MFRSLGTFILTGVLCFLIAQTSFAGGSVSFTDDVYPMLKESQALVKPTLDGLEINNIGTATRTGRDVCPALGGTRISPYIFDAKERGGIGTELEFIVNSDIDFYDSSGRIVFHVEDGVLGDSFDNLVRAVKLKETFRSFTVRIKKPSSVSYLAR